jgi:Tol biopolymer transport system component
MLAFVADPHGTGELALYIYSTISGEVHAVPLPLKGSVSRPVWSPDSIRLAFELLHNGQVSILDYNTQNQGLLTITSVVKTKANPTDDIVTLDWSPDVSVPAITWSVGKVGHIHSIWQGRVGVEDAAGVQILAQGNYAQAVYSQAEYGGSWLLVSLLADHTGDIERVDLNSTVVRLTRGKSANFAQWSPDGKHISYLDAVSAGVGTLHEVNLATGIDTLLASGVAYTPSPTWSFNSQHLVYSTGTHIGLVDVPKAKASRLLKLEGSTSAFLWSATQAYQLLVVLDDVEQGIYLVDIQSGTWVKLDKEGTHGPLVWTQIS